MREPFPVAVAALLVGAGLASASTGVRAQTPKDEAKRHFEAGNALVEIEDYKAASAEFETSIGLYPTKMGLFNLANCYKLLRRYGDALDAINRLKKEFAGRLGELETEVVAFEKSLAAIVGRLEVHVDRDGASIAVDGVEVGRSPLQKSLVLAPGDHSVVVKLPPSTTRERTVRVVAGERRIETFDFAPQKAAPVPPPVAAPGPQQKPAQPVASKQTPPESKKAPVVAGEEEEGLSAIEKARLAPAAPPPGKSWLSGKLKPVFWSGVAATAVSGVLSGVFYGLAGKASDHLTVYKKEYADLAEQAAANPADATLAEREADTWKKMEDANSEMNTYGNLGTGFVVAAGVFAAATVTVAVVSAKRSGKERREAPAVSAAPGGVVVAF